MERAKQVRRVDDCAAERRHDGRAAERGEREGKRRSRRRRAWRAWPRRRVLRRWRGGEGGGHLGGGANEGGLQRLDEDQAAVVGVVAGAAGGELGDVERREEAVDVLARLAWPDAQQCGEDDGQEEAAEVDAARQVLGVLLE